MHFILGALGTIVTILILFKRLSDAGIDLSWLNPFVPQRSRASEERGNPILSLTDPLEVAALMATAIAMIDGELGLEKEAILRKLFQKEFHKTEKEASDLLISSIHLVGDGKAIMDRPEVFLAISMDSFDKHKAQSVMSLLANSCKIDEKNTEVKAVFIQKIEETFSAHFMFDEQA